MSQLQAPAPSRSVPAIRLPALAASDVWNVASAAVLVLVILTNVYRSATQSITLDEAVTYQHFVATPVSSWARAPVPDNYVANNHVLNSLLAKASVTLFGPGPLQLRIPAIAGGALFAACIYFLLTPYYAGTPWFPLTFGLVLLNPGILDFLSAARGYGLALGFSALALLLCVNYLRRRHRVPPATPLLVISLTLALAVISNLTFLFFTIPLGLSVLAVLQSRASTPRTTLRAAACLTLPAVFALAAIQLPVSFNDRPRHFYVGYANPSNAVRDVFETSFLHTPAFADAWRQMGITRETTARLASLLAAGVVLYLAFVAIRIRRVRPRSASPADLPFLLTTIALGGALTLLLVAHGLAGIKFPLFRTGLYFPAFLTLAIALLPQSSFMKCRPLQRQLLAAVISCVTLLYAAQFQTTFYYDWRHDADAAAVASVIRDQSALSSSPLTIGGIRHYGPAFNYYRRTTNVPTGTFNPLDHPPLTACDLLILNASPIHNLFLQPPTGYREIYRNPLTGTLVFRAP